MGVQYSRPMKHAIDTVEPVAEPEDADGIEDGSADPDASTLAAAVRRNVEPVAIPVVVRVRELATVHPTAGGRRDVPSVGRGIRVAGSPPS